MEFFDEILCCYEQPFFNIVNAMSSAVLSEKGFSF